MGIDSASYEILRDTLTQKSSVFFSGDGTNVTFQSRLIEVNEDSIKLENTVIPKYIRDLLGSKHYSLMVQMIRFQADKLNTDGVNLIFPLKEDSVIQETRGSERFVFSADERVVCEFMNPFDEETRLTKSVMDMSATGLSIRTTYDSKLFERGTRFPQLRVLIDGELYTQTTGSVVYTRRLLDLHGHLRLQVGIKFEN
jgi:hypothetical protein